MAVFYDPYIFKSNETLLNMFIKKGAEFVNIFLCVYYFNYYGEVLRQPKDLSRMNSAFGTKTHYAS